MAEQSIEIDCAPFAGRPTIESIIDGLPIQPREPVSTFFGNWIYDYSDIDPSIWAEVRPILKERIIALYNNGQIRYGSW